MAVVIGTNAGFVTTAPTANPSGVNADMENGEARALKDTSSSTAAKIIEIGWWNNTQPFAARNFEVGLYSDDGGTTGELLEVDRTNTLGAGDFGIWKRVTVDWTISPDTVYWIGVQLDAGTAANIAREFSGGVQEFLTAQTTLPDNFDGSSSNDDPIALYALWEEAATGFTRKIKIAGTFQDKPIKTKVGGTFVDKPIKIKVGGTFQDA